MARRLPPSTTAYRWQTVYGALAFHCDNEAAIDEAIRKARELGEKLGARSIQSAIQEMKERLKAP